MTQAKHHRRRNNGGADCILFLACSVLAGPCLAQQPAAPASDANAASGSAPVIIPQPKRMEVGAGRLLLRPGAKWVLRGASRDERVWAAAQSLLGQGSGRFQQSAQPFVSLTLGTGPQTSFPAGPTAPRWAADPEGYQLTIATNGLALLAGTAPGAFYGLQTLAQLLQEAGPERACPALRIEDWPAMRFRGTHWFPSASGVPMHLKLIENVFGPLKFNHCIIQCEAAQWDTHPEITAPNAISKTDLRKLVAACRARCLEPVPLLNVPGHAEWVFRNGSNLDFAEDPKTPFAYCVNHPRSFEFIQDVLNECLPIFEPKYCHVGHDEVTMRGRFPNPECPRCKDATTTALMVKHANGLNEWLKQRQVQGMMWGDMLLGPGEAKDAALAKTLEDARQRRAGISKEMVIVDWHYAAAADARSMELFRKEGFRVVAASWYAPDNVWHLSQAALKSGAEGLLQTTWMGFFPDERALKTQLQQFTAFVLAAEYAWSGRNVAPAQLGYEPKAVFLKAYHRRARPASLPD